MVQSSRTRFAASFREGPRVTVTWAVAPTSRPAQAVHASAAKPEAGAGEQYAPALAPSGLLPLLRNGRGGHHIQVAVGVADLDLVAADPHPPSGRIRQPGLHGIICHQHKALRQMRADRHVEGLPAGRLREQVGAAGLPGDERAGRGRPQPAHHGDVGAGVLQEPLVHVRADDGLRAQAAGMGEGDPHHAASGLDIRVRGFGQQRRGRGGKVDLAVAALAPDGPGKLGEQLPHGALAAEQTLHVRRDVKVGGRAPLLSHLTPSRVPYSQFSHACQTGQPDERWGAQGWGAQEGASRVPGC